MVAQEGVLEEPVKETQIQPKEELKEVNFGVELGSQKPDFISSQLTAQEKEQLVALLKKYMDIFAWTYDEMPGLDPELVVHALNVDSGVKPWLSNIVPVKKKNGQIRCYVDFRNLNKACPKDEFPLPNIDLLVDSAAGSSMFSFMDGYSGYNQIRMPAKDTKKTAFRTLIRNFYYTMMPYGLKNSGATYQRTRTAIFHDMMHKELEDYMDDIVVKSKTRTGHLQVLEQVFKRCRKYKLHMNPMKCAFGGVCWEVSWVPASNFQAIGALLAQEDEDGNEQPIYYVSRTLKNAETRYPRIEKACLMVIYTSQRLKRSQDPKGCQKPSHSKSTSTVPRKRSSLSEEILGEVVVAEILRKKWTMRFDGSATTTSNGVGVVLSYEDRDTIPLSFKLGFPYSNNAAEYEAYLTGLTVVLNIGVKHMSILGDSNLVVSQVKGDFALREQSLATYRTWAQKLEREFQTFSIEYTQRSENRFANVLATLGSQVSFKGKDTLVRIGRQEHSIIRILQKMSSGESKQWD
nr:uncharacterized protein LOC111991691 [Quercus suber]